MALTIPLDGPSAGKTTAVDAQWRQRPDWSELAQPPDPKTGVIAHTADPTAYVATAGATILPRANARGKSLAFDTDPDVLIVDPANDGTGGFAIKLSQVDSAVVKRLSGQVDDPAEILRAATFSETPVNKAAGMPSPSQFVSGAPGAISAQVAPARSPESVLEPVSPPNLSAAVASLESVLSRFMSMAQVATPAPPPVAEPVKVQAVSPVAQPATADDLELPFLTTPASAPQVIVVFDLGRYGGKHRKRYHAASVFGRSLQLIYDTRYPGDQFIPPETEEGSEPIALTFPKHGNRTIKAIVLPENHHTIGCLDVFLFLVAEDSQDGQPLVDNGR